MSGVGDYRSVLHHFEVLPGDDVLVAGDGDENIADLCGFSHRHHAESVHHGFEGLGGINLGHDHVGAHALSSGCQASSAPAVARDHEF